jgi:hypothetical protein
VTFSLPNSAIDPVVVGMLFKSADNGVTITADVSGEQIGDVVFSLPSKTVGESRNEVVNTARTFAGELFQSADVLAKALTSSSREVE